ncbi:ras GEF, partial [Rickenella mellea]
LQVIYHASFASSITTPETIAKDAKDLASTIDIMINQTENAQLDEYPSPTRTIPKGHDITPAGLAVGLTLLENDKYQAITTVDCISHLLRTQSPNKVTAVQIANKQIMNWVKKSILRTNRLDGRRDVFKFFVNTAEECRKLNNFSSMAAVVVALESTTLARLYIENLFKKLATYVDPAGNHQAYRSLLSQRNNGPCVPWLPIHLKDMSSIQRSMPKVVERDGLSLINFERHFRVLKAVDTALSFKNGAYNFETSRYSVPLAYLESELANVRVDDATDMGFEERSLDLKTQEDKIFEDRLLELQAVGFGSKNSQPKV